MSPVGRIRGFQAETDLGRLSGSLLVAVALFAPFALGKNLEEGTLEQYSALHKPMAAPALRDLACPVLAASGSQIAITVLCHFAIRQLAIGLYHQHFIINVASTSGSQSWPCEWLSSAVETTRADRP